MALTAPTMLSLACLVTWNMLVETPFAMKNTLFARFLTSLSVIESIAAAASLSFAPGLLDVVQAASPPTIDYFKGLPTNFKKRWGVYAITMEKDGRRPRLYIGSGTSFGGGVASRLKQYDDGFLLPEYVNTSLREGFVITHKGLLCWIPIPTAALVPIRRLLFFGLEAAFTYVFWALKAQKGDYKMGHFCRWDYRNLPYDGLCTHVCLNEGIPGNFEMTAEELEAHAADAEKKRVQLKAINGTNWHHKKMATEYADYMDAANARVAKSRANNPGRDAKQQARRIKEALAEQKWHCKRCNSLHGTKQRWENHLKTKTHLNRRDDDRESEFWCEPCWKLLANQQAYNTHLKKDTHKKKAAAYAAAQAEREDEAFSDEDEDQSFDDDHDTGIEHEAVGAPLSDEDFDDEMLLDDDPLDGVQVSNQFVGYSQLQQVDTPEDEGFVDQSDDGMLLDAADDDMTMDDGLSDEDLVAAVTGAGF